MGVPWDALATLASGALAVGAATFVAIRQLEISKRQTAIQEELAEIEAAKLRAELFDRRFAVYEATARFAAAIVAHAKFPADDIARDFQLAMDRARLLFRPSVSDFLQVAWGRACDLMSAADTLEGVRSPAERRPYVEAKADCLKYFVDLLTNLSELFGDELRLGALRSAPRGRSGRSGP